MNSRLDVAKELGATHGINTKEQPDLARAIRGVVPGVNHIVDCAGVTPLTGEAIKALAIGGMLGLVAVPPSPDRNFEAPWFDTLLQGQIIQGFTEGNSIPTFSSQK